MKIPAFLPKTATCPPFKRLVIGALRYDFEVRLHSVTDLKYIYRDLLTPAQVQHIVYGEGYPDIKASMCSVAWLVKQRDRTSLKRQTASAIKLEKLSKEKNHDAN